MSDHHIVLRPSDEEDILCTAEIEGRQYMVIESQEDNDEVSMIEPDDATYDMFIVIPHRVLATVNGEVVAFITTLLATAHRHTM